jgi:hypothetical protein
MLNEAIDLGVRGMALTAALNSVNRVLADEIHLWALTTTAAVIGGNNNPPSDALISDMLSIAKIMDAPAIIEQLKKQTGPRANWKIEITVNGKPSVIRFFNEFSDVDSAMAEANKNKQQFIAVIGETSAKTVIKMSDSLRDSLGEDINTEYYNSVLRGIFANTDKGGMALFKYRRLK